MTVALRNFTGESGADAAGNHSISVPTGTTSVHFQSLTVSTRGADIGADVKVAITDGGRERWIAYLRSGQIHAAHFNDIGKIILANNPSTLGITTGAGGAACIVVVSAVVEANVNPNFGDDSF
jgi:hypothetical protein